MPASRLHVRPAPEMVSSGIREIDTLTGGLPRGCLSEICGPASSGRTSVLLAALAAATRREEVCALVDTTDALDAVIGSRCRSHSGKIAVGALRKRQSLDIGRRASNFRVRVRRQRPDLRSYTRRQKPEVQSSTSESLSLEQALRVTDLLLQSGGFGLVAIDLGDVPHSAARRMPLASWFRFQRAVEPTSTVLLMVAREPCTQTCASLLIRLQSGKKLSALSYQLSVKNGLAPAHAQLLDGLQIEGELLRSRLERKPAQSVTAAFATKAVRIS